MANVATGPRGHLLWGHLPDMARDPMGFYSGVWREYGDFVRLHGVGTMRWYLVAHPDDIEQVLQRHHARYLKGWANAQFKVALGNGLVSSEGEFWLRQRRLVQPAFHRERIAALGGLAAHSAEAMCERWHERARSGEVVDALEEMLRLSLEVAGRALFSAETGEAADVVGRALPILIEHIMHRMTHPLQWPESLPTPRNRRFVQARRAMQDVVERLISERQQARERGETESGNDLLSLLMQARDAGCPMANAGAPSTENNTGMSARQLRDETMTLLGAGHETTAVALAWTWAMLDQHPEARERLHSELETVLGGRAPAVQDLERLPCTRMVIDETLRLHPPIWMVTREAGQDDEIRGHRVRRGEGVSIPLFLTHRHPEFWNAPDEFNPERFAPEYADSERGADRHRYAYFPFGGGPRVCIGRGFALMTAQLVLATVAQRYALRLARPGPVEAEPMITLRPRGGLPVTLHERA